MVNQLTEATVLQPSPPTCYIPPQCLDEAEADDSGASDESGGDGVSILAQAQVGPYDMVQLESSDGSALTQWLTAHGYQIPASTKPIIDACVTQGFNLLALKLVPGVGVQSMQPVRVTSQGAAPSLPLRMVAVGTGPTTGITVWVVADGRWAPTSFPTFTIDPSEIVWDWTTSSSNYETLRLAREASYMGSGLQIESSLELNQGGIQQSLLSNVGFVAHARRWPWTARERSSCLSDSRVGHASTAARHSQQTPSGGVYVGMTRPTTGRAPGLPGEIHRRRAAHAERLDVEPALVAQEEHVEGARGEVRVGHADEILARHLRNAGGVVASVIHAEHRVLSVEVRRA